MIPTSRLDVFDAINAECKRQIEKWGEQHHHPAIWLPILTEEFLEAIRAFLEADEPQLTHKVIQIAAVCVAWIEDLFDWRSSPDKENINGLPSNGDQ